jgi:hypothetical protein
MGTRISAKSQILQILASQYEQKGKITDFCELATKRCSHNSSYGQACKWKITDFPLLASLAILPDTYEIAQVLATLWTYTSVLQGCQVILAAPLACCSKLTARIT